MRKRAEIRFGGKAIVTLLSRDIHADWQIHMLKWIYIKD